VRRFTRLDSTTILAHMLYDRPVADLMAEAAREMHAGCQPSDLVAWFARRYPKVKPGTVRAHVIGLTANDRNRHHYPSLAGREPLFFRAPNGTLERFDPDRHLSDETPDDPAEEDSGDALAGEEPAVVEAPDFYLEAYLEEFLLTNWQRIEFGRRLELWRGSGGVSGHQLGTPIGRLDFLCIDPDDGSFVVIELKRGRPADRAVGQVARYMGWVAANIADGRKVDGIIISHDTDDRLRYAAMAVPGLQLLTYQLTFTLSGLAPASGN
jgi:hypothetical protein